MFRFTNNEQDPRQSTTEDPKISTAFHLRPDGVFEVVLCSPTMVRAFESSVLVGPLSW
jgi:hypothetical protein